MRRGGGHAPRQRRAGAGPHSRRGAAPAADEAAQPAGAAPPPPALRTLATEARDPYQRALDAQRQGNWAAYGEEIKRLGDVLQRMEAARQ